MMSETPLLRVQNISKAFGETVANDDISFEIGEGEVLCILGENGAGKTTLMNILSGLYRSDSGEIFWEGKPVAVENPSDALTLGIGMVHQHFLLVPTLTVAENILFSMPRASWFIDRDKVRSEISELSRMYGLPIRSDALVGSLSMGERQRVEILKTLSREVRLLILDEPTSVLAPQEVEQFWETLRALRIAGLSIILITHKLPEARAIADRIIVLRGGRQVGNWNNDDVNDSILVGAIMGSESSSTHLLRTNRTIRSATTLSSPSNPNPEARNKAPQAPSRSYQSVVLSQATTAGNHVDIKEVGLEIHSGEIVGIAGIDGNGQSVLARVLAGVHRLSAGEIHRNHTLNQIAFIPADRLGTGLIGSFPVFENSLTRSLSQPRWYLWRCLPPISWRRVKRHAKELIKTSSVKATPGQPAEQLSGGNQQKLILARETFGRPKLVVAEQPTQGLDIGATASIIQTLHDLRDSGAGIAWISSNLEELMRESDRILVIYRGEIVGSANPLTATAYEVGQLMLGVSRDQ